MSGLQALAIVAHLSIAICGGDRVPPALLDKAEDIAADVYRDIGIAIDWTGECGENEGALEVDLVGGYDIDTSFANVTLGFAAPGTSAATVLYDRVGPFARRFRLKPEVLLGYTIAHEVGHLLLPPNSHSPSGVMRANLDLEQAAARKLRFTKEQRELIVGRLGGVSLVVAMR